MLVKKFPISSSTNEERKSGLDGEKGEMERGGRLLRAFLHSTERMVDVVVRLYT